MQCTMKWYPFQVDHDHGDYDYDDDDSDDMRINLPSNK